MTVCLLRQLLPFLPKVQHGKQNMFTLSLFLKTYPTPSSTWRKQAEALEGRLFQNSQCQKLWRCCWSPRRLHTWKDGSDRQMFIFKKCEISLLWKNCRHNIHQLWTSYLSWTFGKDPNNVFQKKANVAMLQCCNYKPSGKSILKLFHRFMMSRSVNW